jgi:FMN phosphatase YigB (HAD superfamily)
MSKISAVFFDFDGVLCTDKFYSTLVPDYPKVFSWVGEHIFGGEKYCDRWMRGEFTYRQINKITSDATGIFYEQLNKKLLTSVRRMKVNPSLMHIKTALVTNNMDVFNEITISEKRLDNTFPVIVNSYDYKIMKQDENGRLFDIALSRLGLSSYEGVLLIDDSMTYCNIFKEKGGLTYHYSEQKDFELWVKSWMSPPRDSSLRSEWA